MTARGASTSPSKRGSEALRGAAFLGPLAAALLAMSVVAVAPAAAQEATRPAPEGILILSQEELFAGSRYGQRVQQELERASGELSAENREIEARLTAEELRLTEQRAEMTPEEFRPLAEEFDARVESIRNEQDAKARALATAAERAQARFFELIVPILLDIVQERGAAVIMDNRAVILSAETVDITEVAITRVDEAIGDGGEAPLIDLGPAASGGGAEAGNGDPADGAGDAATPPEE